VTEYRKWHSPTNYTRVCYDVTGTQHLATDTGDPECKSSVATEHYDEGMTYKLCETCYPESGVSCDSAAAQWLADYEYAIETDPHTTANDIGVLAERAVAVIRAQQAELAALKATPTLENGEERIWIDGIPHVVVNGEWVRDEEMWRDMNDEPKG
jgi:hypothetical protein